MNQERIPVLIFNNALGCGGGVATHLLQLMRGLDRRVFELHFAGPPERVADLPDDIRDEVQPLTILWEKPTDLRGAVTLARYIRRHHIGILHSHMFDASFLASPLGWLCGVPVVIETAHVREAWRRGWKKSYFIDRCVSRFIHRYIAVSGAVASYLIQEKGLRAEKITVIRNAVKLDTGEILRAGPKLRARLGLCETDPAILVAGRLDPQKGHRVLLDAMPEVLRAHPRAHLFCLGTGPLRDELRLQIERLGLEQRVRLMGHEPKSEMGAWLAMADLCVLPSFFEGLPYAALEALAAGKAMVATAVDGTPEVVVDGRTGLTVPPGDPESLAKAICRLLDDPELRLRLGRDGRKFVEQDFSEQKLLDDTTALYLRAWEESRKRKRFRAVVFAGPVVRS